MIRVVIDRIVVDGVPGLREAEVRKHLERELALALADLHTLSERPNRPSPIRNTTDASAFAASVALSLREVLDGR